MRRGARKLWPKRRGSIHATIHFMCTANVVRTVRWMFFACALLWVLRSGAEAHPVAQGGLIVTISPSQLTVRATVSLEEVLVASAYGPESARAKSSAEAAQLHGPYLLEHLRISADGRLLHGRIVDSRETTEKPKRFAYEFEFAPGNRWEASYIVQIEEEGHAVREGLLLTSRQPLVFVRENQSASSSAAPRLDRWQVLRDYFHHGLLHILTGYDHLLFVTALV